MGRKGADLDQERAVKMKLDNMMRHFMGQLGQAISVGLNTNLDVAMKIFCD